MSKSLTEAAVGFRAFLAKVVISLAQIRVAKHLIGLSDLPHHTVSDESTAANRRLYLLKLGVRRLVVGILVGVQFNGHLAIGLFNVNLRRCGHDTQRIVVCRVLDHVV
jgi:hypothetical protein